MGIVEDDVVGTDGVKGKACAGEPITGMVASKRPPKVATIGSRKLIDRRLPRALSAHCGPRAWNWLRENSWRYSRRGRSPGMERSGRSSAALKGFWRVPARR